MSSNFLFFNGFILKTALNSENWFVVPCFLGGGFLICQIKFSNFELSFYTFVTISGEKQYDKYFQNDTNLNVKFGMQEGNH